MEAQSHSLTQAARCLKVVNLYNAALQAYNRGEYNAAIEQLEHLLQQEVDHQEPGSCTPWP
jgi:outer membrane protein assembly factor BamD (BamD/ComL family)